MKKDDQSIGLIKDKLLQIKVLHKEAVKQKDWFMAACYKAKIEGIEFTLTILGYED